MGSLAQQGADALDSCMYAGAMLGAIQIVVIDLDKQDNFLFFEN